MMATRALDYMHLFRLLIYIDTQLEQSTYWKDWNQDVAGGKDRLYDNYWKLSSLVNTGRLISDAMPSVSLELQPLLISSEYGEP